MLQIVTNAVPDRRRANRAEVAEFFDVSVNAVDAWVRRGCPAVERGARGKSWVFDLLSVAQWRFEPRKADSQADGDADSDPESMSPKERLDWYRGESERLDLLRARGDLIPADEVGAEWSRQVSVAKGRFMALPNRIAQKLAGKDQHEIEAELKREFHEILVELASNCSPP